MVSGGILNAGQIVNWVLGFKFSKDGENVQASISYSNNSMALPEPRMMHQSLIVKHNGKSHLMVCGGKTGLNTYDLKFSNSVLMYPLDDFVAGKTSQAKW